MTPAAQAHRWNGIYAGKDCFLSHGGRVMVCLFGKRLSAARVCCAISDGRYPAHCAFVGAFDDLRRVNIHTSDDRRIKAETIKIAGSIFYEKLEGRYSVALRHYGLNYKFGLWMDRSDAEAALTWGRHELITGRPGHEADDLPDGWDFNLAKSLERMKLSERRGMHGGFFGVSFCKANGKLRADYWQARINCNGSKFARSAKTAIEAAKAYNDLADQHLGVGVGSRNVIPDEALKKLARQKPKKLPRVSKSKTKSDDI